MAKINIKIEGMPYQVEEGLTILEAAKACGYTSPNTFYRAFQKYHKNTELEIPGDPRFTES